MSAIIALLRAVNLAGRNTIKMEVLRELCTTLKLQNPKTYVQSGNVVFGARDQDPVKLSRRIADSIEKSCGFRTQVILRTTEELRSVIARNPFARQKDVEPAKLIVIFLSDTPDKKARERLKSIKADREELHLDGRELYIYFPDGMGRSKVSVAAIEKAVQFPGTGRNWNSVTKLLAMAEQLESAKSDPNPKPKIRNPKSEI
jgi:uncharacterized protein (DUF1697 family)